MTHRALTPEEITQLEGKLSQVLVELTSTEGEVNVDTEFEQIMFSKAGPTDETMAEIREMTKRFGPKLVKLLGFPPAPGVCKINVVENGMRVDLEIEPPAGDGRLVSVEDVRRLLQEHQIVHGIDESAMEKAIEAGRTDTVRGICVARGVPPENGKDGRIEPIKHWEPAPAGMDIPQAIGDYHISASEIETVVKDQKIARLVPPTAGRAGKDVYGLDIPAESGKPIAPEVGENVSFDAHSGYFYSKAPGRVVIMGNLIDIEKIMMLHKDIDISVGHVMFPGELMISGWIRSGLSVQAEDDIVIEGGVEAAVVKSRGGSIFIGKGVQGSGLAMIQAAWDVTAKFIEHAAVMAGGVLKTQSAVGCDLAGGEAVMVLEGKGIVMGGKIYAGDRVEVRELGSGTAEPTVVQLGITPKNLISLSRLKERLQAAQKALADAELALAHFGLTSESLQAEAMTDEGRQLLKMAKTVIVLHNRCRKIRDEEDRFIESMKNRTNGVLDVHGRVHPGVKILIGHATYLVTEPLSWIRFKYDADQRRIKAIPLI